MDIEVLESPVLRETDIARNNETGVENSNGLSINIEENTILKINHDHLAVETDKDNLIFAKENNDDFFSDIQTETLNRDLEKISAVDSSDNKINIKDFAYPVSDLRHFGIYDENEEDTSDYESDYDEDEYTEEELEEEEEEGGETVDIKYQQSYDHYEDRTQEASDAIQLNWDHVSFETNDSKKQININIDTENLEGRYINDSTAQLVSTTLPTTDHMTTNKLNNQQEENNISNSLLHAVALYPFIPENSNELALEPDQILIINYECGDGWLVAHDTATGQTGLVPSEYIRIIGLKSQEEGDEAEREEEDDEIEDEDAEAYQEFAEDVKGAQRFMPEILGEDSI